MKTQIKKLCSFTLAAALALSVTGFCVKALADEASDAKTVTGKITAISGTKVTLEVRDMPENGHSEDTGDNRTPPEKPEGSDSVTPPEMPSDGQTPPDNGQTPPEKPADGQAPSEPPQGSGQRPGGNPPAKPEGDQEAPEGDEQQAQTLTVDLSGTSVDVSTLKVGDMLTVELSGSKVLSADAATPPDKSPDKSSGSNT